MNQIIISLLLQLILFMPFYFIWKNDCKTIGKNNLAVSLEERFLTWLFICPFWLMNFLY